MIVAKSTPLVMRIDTDPVEIAKAAAQRQCRKFTRGIAANASALALPQLPAPYQLGGVGGATQTVLVNTELRLTVGGGGTATFQGSYPAFTQPEALDINILGRDIMNLFAVVLDRHAEVVCNIGKGHRYIIGVQPSRPNCELTLDTTPPIAPDDAPRSRFAAASNSPSSHPARR